MLVTLSGIVMLVIPELKKARYPIDVKPLPSVMLDKPEQLENASASIEVTLSGIIIFDKLVQSAKAYTPIWFKLFPKDTLVKLVQYPKASNSIDVTLSGILILVRLKHS